MKLTQSKYNAIDFDESSDVTFHTEYDVYDKEVEKIKYIFENHTTITVSYGYDTELEVFVNGQWYEINLTRDIDDVAMILNSNKTREDVFQWNIEDYDLPEGKYRIIKQLSDRKYGQLGVFGERKYYAEFEIGKSIYTKYSPYGYEKLQKLPKEYTKKIAIKNDDVVLIEGGNTENTENIDKFIENVDLGIPAFLRITRYLKNGDILITEVEYIKGKYIYRCDSTRTQKNIGIIKKEYPYMITDGNNVYLSNWSNWEYKQKYQGEAGEHLFSKSNGEYAVCAVENVKNIMEECSQGSTIYRVKIKDQEYYFSEQKAIEQFLKLEKRKGHINTKVISIIWHDNGEFLIKAVSDDKKEEYTTVYKLYEQ